MSIVAKRSPVPATAELLLLHVLFTATLQHSTSFTILFIQEIITLRCVR